MSDPDVIITPTELDTMLKEARTIGYEEGFSAGWMQRHHYSRDAMFPYPLESIRFDFARWRQARENAAAKEARKPLPPAPAGKEE